MRVEGFVVFLTPCVLSSRKTSLSIAFSLFEFGSCARDFLLNCCVPRRQLLKQLPASCSGDSLPVLGSPRIWVRGFAADAEFRSYGTTCLPWFDDSSSIVRSSAVALAWRLVDAFGLLNVDHCLVGRWNDAVLAHFLVSGLLVQSTTTTTNATTTAAATTDTGYWCYYCYCCFYCCCCCCYDCYATAAPAAPAAPTTSDLSSRMAWAPHMTSVEPAGIAESCTTFH